MQSDYGCRRDDWKETVDQLDSGIRAIADLSSSSDDKRCNILNEFLESLLDGREIQLKYDGKEYCIFNIGADNSVEKSKILVGEGNAEESFVEYSNIYNFIKIYQINGRKIKDILSDCFVTWRNI